MTTVRIAPKRKYHAVWISDIHLGCRGCKADFLLSFLNSIECDYLYLVGDIIDIWHMRRKGLYWPQSHNNVIRSILGKAKHKTKVIYIPGNHDENFREFAGTVFGNVEIHEQYTHTTVDNKKLLIMHGDEFDGAIRCSKLVGLIGDVGYDLLLYINRWFNYFRAKLGSPYWSISSYIKNKVQNAVKTIDTFEQAVAHEARRRGVDGLVCGHIHHAEIRNIDGILYCNDGDWVENCTAMIEQRDGTLEIIHWSDEVRTLKQYPSALHPIDIRELDGFETERPERKTA